MQSRTRKMIMVDLNNGNRKLVDTPSITLAAYIGAMRRLNENAYEYRVLYLPIDQEFNDFVDEVK